MIRSQMVEQQKEIVSEGNNDGIDQNGTPKGFSSREVRYVASI